jgi:hypothetical protein
MTIHLQKFVDRVRGAEAKGARDLILSISDAKDLHADITRLLLRLQEFQQGSKDNNDQNQIVAVKIEGGTFR